MNPRQEHELGVFVHGVLAGLHMVAMAYNIKNRNPFSAIFHSVAIACDTFAACKHTISARKMAVIVERRTQ